MLSSEVQPYFDAFIKFTMDTNWQVIRSEHTVISQRHAYAGTLDLLGELNGYAALIDIKCAATIAAWVGLQLAGYHLAFEDQEGELYPQMRRYALRLKRDGTYQLHPFRSSGDRGDFLAARRMAAWQLKHGGYYL